MTETELLSLGSTLAQVTVAALGLGAIFYVLIAQRADAKVDKNAELLERFVAPMERAVQQAALLEGNIHGFARFTNNLKRTKGLEGPDAERLSFAGNSIYWAGRLKRETRRLVRAAALTGVPTIVGSVVLISFSKELEKTCAATWLSVLLVVSGVAVLVLNGLLIWRGSQAKPGVSVPGEVPKLAIAYFPSGPVLRRLQHFVFVEEAFDWSYDSIQTLRRVRRKMYPVWHRLTTPPVPRVWQMKR
jgi:hypothetical protein